MRVCSASSGSPGELRRLVEEALADVLGHVGRDPGAVHGAGPDVGVLVPEPVLGVVGAAVEDHEAALGGALAEDAALPGLADHAEGPDLLDDLGGVLARLLAVAAQDLAGVVAELGGVLLDLDPPPVELVVLAQVLHELVADGVGLLRGGQAPIAELLVEGLRVGRLREVPEDELDRVLRDAAGRRTTVVPGELGQARRGVHGVGDLAVALAAVVAVLRGAGAGLEIARGRLPRPVAVGAAGGDAGVLAPVVVVPAREDGDEHEDEEDDGPDAVEGAVAAEVRRRPPRSVPTAPGALRLSVRHGSPPGLAESAPV